MAVRREHLVRLLMAALLVAIVLLLAGCSTGDPENTFAPAGDVARKQRDLFNLVLWPAVAILVIVEGLLVVAVMRFRQRGDQPSLPKQVHGNTRFEIAWTIAPTILLLVLAVPTVAAVIDLGRAPATEALQIKVTGRQWIWQFEYPEFKDADGKPLSVFNELHIPVGREIGAYLHSPDVIHSFWVPRLAGKLDVIPGRENRMWFNAEEPGTYSGQCAEFCGLGHAGMRMTVVAQTEEEFNAWVQEQLKGG